MNIETFTELVGGESSPSGPSQSTSSVVFRLVAHVILISLSIVAIAPFAWAFMSSLKPPTEIIRTLGVFIPSDPTLVNYRNIWFDMPLDRWFLNSLVLATGTVFLTLLFDSLAGFALAKGDFFGRKAVFVLVLGTIFIPPQSILVPLYLEMQWLNWHNTYWAMMVLLVSTPFGTFLMRQYYVGVPSSLLESARIDGCSTFQVYTRIMLPMGKPALAALAVFKFIAMWGAFLWPFLMAEDSAMFPLQVGIALLQGQYQQQLWGRLLAAVILAALPVMVTYVFAQRAFMEGIALRGRKGL